MNRKQYWTCPFCHSNLDYGEKCDCEVMKERQKELYSQKIKLSPKTGQYSFQWDGKDTGHEKENVG